jgi:hypothetical protein
LGEYEAAVLKARNRVTRHKAMMAFLMAKEKVTSDEVDAAEAAVARTKVPPPPLDSF